MNEKQRILITGANGYLGAQFCRYLAAQGHKVTALCFPQLPQDQDWCHSMEEVLVGSIAEDATIELLSAKSFDSIVHLVSLDHRQSQQASPEEVLNVNVQPCWKLLNTFAPRGLKRFLFFSTIHVYGLFSAETIIESHPLAPANVYALTHALSEKICEYFNRTTPTRCVTVRLSNSYGHPVFPENNCWWLAVNDLCRSAYYDKHIRLLSDGSPQRDFIHGSDVSVAVELLLTRPDELISEDVYHISSSETYTLMELAGLVKETYFEMYGLEIPVNTPDEMDVKAFDRFAGLAKYTIDNASLRTLGFQPAISLREGIQRLFRYFENQSVHA
jgi:UDP-glucose 4-epimerase